MPTIIDPTDLIDGKPGADSNGANIFIDVANKTIKIKNNFDLLSGTANDALGQKLLDETGVTLQALYSFCKEQWKDDPQGKDLIAYPFPLVAITPEQFEWRYGWEPEADASRELIRTAGWREYENDNSTINREFVGVITLGSILGDQPGDQAINHKAYYAIFDKDSSQPPLKGPIDFKFPGPVNEAVKTFQLTGKPTDTDNRAFDNRNDILTVFIRQGGYTFDQTSSIDIGIPAGTTLPYNCQRFPLSEGADINITVSDGDLSSLAKYDGAPGPRIEYLHTSRNSNDAAFGFSPDLTGGPYPFGIVIDAQSGDGSGNLTNQELYSWVNFKLRQETNIEDSSLDTINFPGPTAQLAKIGKLQDQLLEFVGPDLQTLRAKNLDQGIDSGEGVLIYNFNAGGINDLSFRSDSAGTGLRTFPFTAAGTINFSNEIVSDAGDAKYFIYYDYTKVLDIPSGDLTITQLGRVDNGDGVLVDSVTFKSAGGNFSNSNAAQGSLGISLTHNVEATRYFYLHAADGGALNENNKHIWQVTDVATGGAPAATYFSARAFDNDSSSAQASIAQAIEIRERPINSPGALLVNVVSGSNPGTLAGPVSSVQFTYAYETNTDGNKPSAQTAVSGGGTRADAEADIVIRAIGLNSGSWAETTGKIQESTTQSYSVVSAIERNYSNP